MIRTTLKEIYNLSNGHLDLGFLAPLIALLLGVACHSEHALEIEYSLRYAAVDRTLGH